MDNRNLPPTIVSGVFNKFRPHCSEAFNGYRREINRGLRPGEFSLSLYNGDRTIAHIYSMIPNSAKISCAFPIQPENIFMLGVTVEPEYSGRGLGKTLWVEALKEISHSCRIFNDFVVDESTGWTMAKLPEVITEMEDLGFKASEVWDGEFLEMPAKLIEYSKE